MLGNRKNKGIQRKLSKTQISANSEEERFQQNLLERMERQENLFLKKFVKYTQAFLMMGQIMNH